MSVAATARRRKGMPMSFTIRTSALLLCLGFVCAIPAQAAELGWYVVGFGGESSASGASENLATEKLIALFEANGVEVLDATATIDDSDTGFGLVGGYQLNDHLAFEFAYVDLGSVSYDLAARVSDGTNEADADVQLESSADGPVLSALGILPIGERFSVFGRVGFSLMNAKGTARITINDVTSRPNQSSQKSDLMYGVGAEFDLSKYFAIRLAWDRYMDVGTENVTGDIDADLFSLGLRMGVGWFQ
jgi:OOP family OmpA-OmpF porin